MWQAGVKPRTLGLHDNCARDDLLTLSVVPFRNLSGEPEQVYYAEGICEDVITGLSNNSALRVFSRTVGSVAPKDSGRSAAEFVLEGSLRRSGGRTRVAARLTDSGSDAKIWAEQFDSDGSDLFDLQDDIVASIVHGLGAADGVIEKSARQRSSERLRL
jgi:adenylate cyclase